MGCLRIVRKGTYGEITQVDGCPGDVLGHTGNNVDDYFSYCNKHDMDHPCACMNTQRGKAVKECEHPGKAHTPLRLTHSALMLAYAAWSSASSLELSTCSTLRKLLLRPRLWGCSETPGSLMLGGLMPLMVGWVEVERRYDRGGRGESTRAQRVSL